MNTLPHVMHLHSSMVRLETDAFILMIGDYL